MHFSLNWGFILLTDYFYFGKIKNIILLIHPFGRRERAHLLNTIFNNLFLSGRKIENVMQLGKIIEKSNNSNITPC